ncbi:unnamed protein product [Cyprideis torosa]|uniref:Uncharacterized protein n=1 Tax=Cyprideis torosa TaxID=163714 RepID=A0A7R8ZUR2_9CRUS|nr:unnamed protein product [Cyprideis torosa]CAG0900759.1 unnamed protein product [Cyprideis torosa]
MEANQISPEELIKHSLMRFVRTVAPPEEDVNELVDDVLLLYVSGVVEEIQDDCFDMDAFLEVMAGHLPGLKDEERAVMWIQDLSKELGQLRREKEKLNGTRPNATEDLLADSFREVRLRTVSSSSSSGTGLEPGSSSGVSSAGSSTEADDVAVDPEALDALRELFPPGVYSEGDLCRVLKMAAQRVLLASPENGSASTTVDAVVGKAAQLLLDGTLGEENGLHSLVPRPPAPVSVRPMHKPKIDDRALREQILAKYSYIDAEEDSRQHRPPPLKYEGKKLIRYRDNQVVTVKGEKYTEIKRPKDAAKDEGADLKKTYINLKPARQYRFH